MGGYYLCECVSGRLERTEEGGGALVVKEREADDVDERGA